MYAVTAQTDAISLIHVAGPRLDLVHAPALRAEADKRIAEGAQALIVDMQDVTFIDSSGLGTLVGLVKRVGSRQRLILTGLQEPGLSLLRLSHMDEVFLLEDTADAARRKLASARG